MSAIRKLTASPYEMGQQAHGLKHLRRQVNRSIRAGFPLQQGQAPRGHPVMQPKSFRPLVRAPKPKKK